MKVKLFWKNDPLSNRYDDRDKNAQDFEDQINAWLSENPRIRIVEIKQSASLFSSLGLRVSLWFVSVWYEEDAACPTPTPAS